jgi:pimeloyl-ACP methyl ester carboxylesterase
MGSGRLVVVLHGLGNDHRVPEAGLEPVFTGRPGWKRVYLDLPGHGLSPGEDWIQSNDDMVAAVVHFIDSTFPSESFSIVGHSYGGYLARGVVHHLSSRVDGLLLWVPSTYPRSERILPKRAVLVEDLNVWAELKSEEERFYGDVFVVRGQDSVDVIRNLLVPAAKLVNESFVSRISDSVLSFDAENPQFTKPTLIVCGRHDFVAGYQNNWSLLEKYARGSLAVLDGAGHALGIPEQREMFRRLVGHWIDGMRGEG